MLTPKKAYCEHDGLTYARSARPLRLPLAIVWMLGGVHADVVEMLVAGCREGRLT